MNTPTTTNPMRLLVSFNKLEVDGNQELHTGSNTNGTNYEVFLQYHTAKVGEMCRVTTDGESKLRFQLEHRVERTENSSGRYAIIDTLKQNNPRSLNTNKSNSHRGQVAVVTLDARGCPIACRMEGRIGETIDDWFKVPESGGSERYDLIPLHRELSYLTGDPRLRQGVKTWHKIIFSLETGDQTGQSTLEPLLWVRGGNPPPDRYVC